MNTYSLRLTSIVFAVCSLLLSVLSRAQDEPTEVELFHRQFSEMSKELSFRTKENQPLVALDAPLMKFSVGNRIHGGVYLWLDSNKNPAMIGSLGSLELNGRDWGFCELHVLSTDPLEPTQIEAPIQKSWKPGSPHPTSPIVDAPAAATSPAQRLAQMRSLAKEFEAQMVAEDGRLTRLRLQPNPLYRLPDSSKTRDGALFAFVLDEGTDPEVILRLEIQRKSDISTWSYQPIRFNWRALRMSRKGTEVWQADEFTQRDDPIQTGAYLTTLTRVVDVKRDLPR